MTTRALPVTLTPLLAIPEVRQGDDIAKILLTAVQQNGIQLVDGDILVVSSKVISKAMGLRAPVGQQAEVVLSQSVRVVAERLTPSGVTRIVQSVAGPVMTAAGVDASNTADASSVLVLPHDPDAVATQIRDGLQSGWLSLSGNKITTGVILSDTAGRPWRNGQTDFALGACGVQVIDDLRGSSDSNGRLLSVTERCVGDEIAAAADLVKGKAAGIPAAHIRGLGQYVLGAAADSGARAIVRTGAHDWFGYGMVEAIRAALGVEPGSATASEVGIAPIVGEEPAIRAMRALRVALLTCPDATGKVDGDAITLLACDDFTLGIASARTEVALHGEGLTASVTRLPSQPPLLNADEPLTDRRSVLIAFAQR
jgi:coenzyme F420-0:L-glutamate ligase/coenzyme F420-1:gamma-L-glutamate ligase